MRPQKFFFIYLYLLLAISFTACKTEPQRQLRFIVISDTHVTRYPHSHEALPKVLKNLLRNKPAPDAIFICGDITDNGWPEEYDVLMATLNDRAIVPESIPVYLMMGNHDNRNLHYVDAGQGQADCNPNVRFMQMNPQELFTAKTGQPLHQYINIKGYPFITVSLTVGDNIWDKETPHPQAKKIFKEDPKSYEEFVKHFQESGAHVDCFDDNAMRFLTDKMADAARTCPGKPIFLFSHIGSSCTTFGTFPQDEGGQDQTNPVLERYPQTVFFSGHSHFPIGDPRVIHQERYTSINAGCANGPSGVRWYLPAPFISQGAPACWEGLIVNVMTDGTVDIERWDANRNEEILPRWQLEPPFDGTKFAYANRNGLPAPAFEAGATVTSYVMGSELLVHFPKATDNEVVNHYFIEFMDENGTVFYSGNKYSFFYLNSQMPELNVLHFNLTGANAEIALPSCEK